MIKQIRQEIEKTEKRNEEMKKALVPCWTEIEQNRGYILGLKYALRLLEQRDCENCKHHTENGCSSWDCRFEPQESEEGMNCEDCLYSDIADWEQDKTTGKAIPVYWCERYKNMCSSISECQYKAESEPQESEDEE